MNILWMIIRILYQTLAGLALLAAAVLSACLSFQWPVTRETINLNTEAWAADPSIRLGMGVGALVLIGIFVAYVSIKSRLARQEPSIAFDNPDGEVSISIKAIEDFVGRIGREFAEVKSLEPSIVARREGVQIELKVELWSGPNIPKLTERIQNVVKNQVQNILGIDNVQSVTLNVGKITARDKDYQMPSQPDIFAGSQGAPANESEQTNIPYQT